MADGCDGSLQSIAGARPRVHPRLRLHEDSTGVRRIRKGLLREGRGIGFRLGRGGRKLMEE